jgi:TM2 domain-containing membrane protein YozV
VKNKVTAALLAFFIGGFGAHRFYLGQTGKGILYLLFCWTPIPWIVAFIDFIIFLTMNDKNFNFKYNQEFIQQLYPHQQAPTVIINNNPQGQQQQYGQQQYGQQQRQQQQQARQQQAQPRPRPAPAPKVDPFQKAGDEKYQDYDFDGAIRDYLRSLNVKATNPGVHFKLGCLYSVMEQTDSAFFHLQKAVEQGFYDFDKIQSHDHLAFLRSQQPTFDDFVSNGYKFGGDLEEQEDKLELSEDIITQLERLAKMKDAGLLTEDEFKAQKVKLLR